MTATAIKYGIVKKTSLGFDQAVEAVTAALADEGFGILTEIDVQAVLKKKLDIERPGYLIPGACKAKKCIELSFCHNCCRTANVNHSEAAHREQARGRPAIRTLPAD